MCHIHLKVSCLTLQWRHTSVMASQITYNPNVCPHYQLWKYQNSALLASGVESFPKSWRCHEWVPLTCNGYLVTDMSTTKWFGALDAFAQQHHFIQWLMSWLVCGIFLTQTYHSSVPIWEIYTYWRSGCISALNCEYFLSIWNRRPLDFSHSRKLPFFLKEGS